MKNVSRIFSAVVCSASLFAFEACGAVATTAGSNLTAYNPSNSYNNQWASMTNGRYDSTASAKVDFGNCNAIVLRCAQPKCANGGCGEMGVAAAIVSGCVKSNDKCKQYGDDLVNYMTAQLVASSQAKINASNAEQIQAAQMAAEQAQAAAQQAQMAQQQQIAEMQSSMQQQMQQMQQQMAEQNAQSAQAIADALAASQQQQQQAISEMRSAATTVAQAEVTGAAVTQEDKEAISRGVSEDVLLRETISGQITTYIGDAKTSLDEVKAAMNTAFEYAGCDNRGDNCAGPKRVKKWRELAVEFIDPYDKVVDNISNALDVAQVVGVDLNDIYMMLNDSCNQWGQYMCPGKGFITYDYYEGNDRTKGQKGPPRVCPENITDIKLCSPCTLLKLYSNKDKDEVYDMWVNTDGESDNNQIVVACASSAMKTGLLARQAKRKSSAGTLDLEVLEEWINARESNTVKNNDANEIKKYCAEFQDIEAVKNKKIIDIKQLCTNEYKDDYCEKINPKYAICDTHPWNAGFYDDKALKSDNLEKTKTAVGNKVTLVSQQLYKQYEYLRATLKRLETSLNKSVLAAKLEKAGAESGGSSGGISVGGNNKNSQYADCAGKTRDETMYCLRGNYSALANKVKNKQCGKAEKTQLETDARILNVLLTKDYKLDATNETPATCNKSGLTNQEACSKCLGVYNVGLINLQEVIDDREAQRRGGYR